MRLNLYLDDDASGNALIMSECANPFLDAMEYDFWMIVGELPINIWIGRVGTKVNPDNLPARHAQRPLPVRAEIGLLDPLVFYVEHLNSYSPTPLHATPSSLVTFFVASVYTSPHLPVK